jgi:hypothetical protein
MMNEKFKGERWAVIIHDSDSEVRVSVTYKAKKYFQVKV